jgi:hypothetical protein
MLGLHPILSLVSAVLGWDMNQLTDFQQYEAKQERTPQYPPRSSLESRHQ